MSKVDNKVAEVIAEAVYAAVMDMSFSEIRELTTGSYMEIRIKMQDDTVTKTLAQKGDPE